MDKARIMEDSRLKRSYGLKNMRDLWGAAQDLKKARREARRLLSLPETERKNEEGIAISKLQRLAVLDEKAKIEDVLSLTLKDILERRLQTRVLRKGLAKTMRQARQFITHGFIAIGDKIVDIPSYMVSGSEDSGIKHSKKIELEHKVAPVNTKSIESQNADVKEPKEAIV